MSYQNTGFKTGQSTFVDVDTSRTATFTSKASKVSIGAQRTEMVSFDVLVEVPKNISDPACDPCANTDINTSIRLKGNFQKGDAASVSALKAELDRLFGLAVENQHLLAGLVPTVGNSFPE